MKVVFPVVRRIVTPFFCKQTLNEYFSGIHPFKVDCRLFELALIRISGLFEAIFIPLGFSLTNSSKYSSVIRTCSYSKFCLFIVIFDTLGRKSLSVIQSFPKIPT